MGNYLMYVGVPVQIEAEDEKQAISLARHTVFNNLSNYDIYDFGVEMIVDD
jgi:hypothetical protein